MAGAVVGDGPEGLVEQHEVVRGPGSRVERRGRQWAGVGRVQQPSPVRAGDVVRQGLGGHGVRRRVRLAVDVGRGKRAHAVAGYLGLGARTQLDELDAVREPGAGRAAPVGEPGERGGRSQQLQRFSAPRPRAGQQCGRVGVVPVAVREQHRPDRREPDAGPVRLSRYVWSAVDEHGAVQQGCGVGTHPARLGPGPGAGRAAAPRVRPPVGRPGAQQQHLHQVSGFGGSAGGGLSEKLTGTSKAARRVARRSASSTGRATHHQDEGQRGAREVVAERGRQAERSQLARFSATGAPATNTRPADRPLSVVRNGQNHRFSTKPYSRPATSAYAGEQRELRAGPRRAAGSRRRNRPSAAAEHLERQPRPDPAGEQRRRRTA